MRLLRALCTAARAIPRPFASVCPSPDLTNTLLQRLGRRLVLTLLLTLILTSDFDLDFDSGFRMVERSGGVPDLTRLALWGG